MIRCRDFTQIDVREMGWFLEGHNVILSCILGQPVTPSKFEGGIRKYKKFERLVVGDKLKLKNMILEKIDECRQGPWKRIHEECQWRG